MTTLTAQTSDKAAFAAQPYLHQLLAGESLSQPQSERFFSAVAQGEVDPVLLSAVLIALKIKGETADEIAGAALAFRKASTPFPSVAVDSIDCCGTGGDGSNTINISTTAALIAPDFGLKVAKHGNRSVSSQSGSADLLEHLGVNIQQSPDIAAKALTDAGVTFLFAPQYHPGVRHAMPVRTQLKTRTLFNLLGPLLNPVAPKFQLLGVYDAKLCDLMAQALLQLGVERAWVVHGAGCDEIALHGVTHVTEVNQGQLQKFTLTAADFGLAAIELADLAGGNPAENAAASRAIIEGSAPLPHLAAIAANVAAMRKIAGQGEDLALLTAEVLQHLQQGKAGKALTLLQEISHG
ncbi:MAG: anthranilate phosphoribosyltransferase [Rheinheimera sp.]